jgi:hypothetical protein
MVIPDQKTRTMKIYEGMYTKAELDGGECFGFTFLSLPTPFRPFPTENPSASVDKKLDEHLSHCERVSEEDNASPCRGSENRGSIPYASNFAKCGVTNPVLDSFPEQNLALENTLLSKLSYV